MQKKQTNKQTKKNKQKNKKECALKHCLMILERFTPNQTTLKEKFVLTNSLRKFTI